MGENRRKLLLNEASKQFDFVSFRNGHLTIQNNGRQVGFIDPPDELYPLDVIKVAVERDVRSCMICNDASVYMGCISCGFGYCSACLQHPLSNPLVCTVCKTSWIATNVITHDVPNFQIECILSFDHSEQEIGYVDLVHDGNCLLVQGSRGDIVVKCLAELVVAMLDVMHKSSPLPAELYKLSTCVLFNSCYPNSVIEQFPVINALLRYNGKFIFGANQDDIECAIVTSAEHISFSTLHIP